MRVALAANTPIACARSRGSSNTLRTIDIATGLSIAPPIACTMRKGPAVRDLVPARTAAMQLGGPQTRYVLPLVIQPRTTSVGSFGPLAFSHSSRRYARDRGSQNGPLFSRFVITAIRRFPAPRCFGWSNRVG